MAQVQAFYDLEKLALFVRVIEEKDFYAHVCYYICVLLVLEKLALFVRVIEEKDFYAHVCYYMCLTTTGKARALRARD
jgi:hypothetical protein